MCVQHWIMVAFSFATSLFIGQKLVPCPLLTPHRDQDHAEQPFPSQIDASREAATRPVSDTRICGICGVRHPTPKQKPSVKNNPANPGGLGRGVYQVKPCLRFVHRGFFAFFQSMTKSSLSNLMPASSRSLRHLLPGWQCLRALAPSSEKN